MNDVQKAFSSPDAGRNPYFLKAGAERWPAELDELGAQKSAGLWTSGNLDTLSAQPRVAIVGTRRSTAYGNRVAKALAEAYARAGACVVSGLAAGIDGAAHRGALDANGPTIAVLGTGLHHAFPKGHRELQRTIAQRGLLLTELEHEEHGMPFTFLVRNRIIAALSRLVIVVEAPTRSGALNTADQARELDRLVAAVPGPIDQPQSEGTNLLIRDGAHVIASVEDALALVGLTPPPRAPKVDPTGNEGRVWAALAGGGLDIESLCQRSGLPASACMAAVSTLELAGSIECALTGEIRRR